MEKVRKVLCFIMVLMVMFSVSATAISSEAQAANQRTSAMRAYKKYLMRSSVDRKVDGATKFAIQDLNHDRIPELVLLKAYDGMPVIVLTYYNKHIKSCKSARHSDVLCLKKGSVFAIRYDHSMIINDSFYQIVKGKAKLVARKYDETMRAGFGDNYSDQFSKKIIYYVGGKKVSKSKYTSYMKKITKFVMLKNRL